MATLTQPGLLSLLQSTYPPLKHPDFLALINGQKWKPIHNRGMRNLLRILRISFPWPICRATASSPSSIARFFELTISTAVLWKTSEISRSSWRGFHGIRLRIKRRNFGVPSLTNGARYILRNSILKRTGLNIYLARETSNVRSNVHKILGRFAKDMLVTIFRQRIEGVTKTTLANKLEGSPSHPR